MVERRILTLVEWSVKKFYILRTAEVSTFVEGFQKCVSLFCVAVLLANSYRTFINIIRSPAMLPEDD